MRLYQNRGGRIAAVSVAALTALLAACSDEARECRVGADCASGQCSAEGQCVRVDPDAGSDGGPEVDAAAGLDASVKDAQTDVSLPGCTPNKDGTITREEVPLAAGLHATYRIGKNENVSTAGTPAAGGRRVWDFSGALASDTSVIAETQPLAGKWFASKFAGATYATRLSDSADLLGVFETSPGALLLRGVVSPSDGATSKTELTNTPAVSVLKFPLTVGAKWNTDTAVSGTAQGVALFGTYSEKYTYEVDAAGELKTPLGTFDVLRVKIVLVRTIGVLPSTTIRTFAFVTECYGTVASITSANNESNEDFTTAAEIRRISP